MKIRELEQVINSELRKINSRYRISKLVETPKGDYWFDFGEKFAAKDMSAVNRILGRYFGKKHKTEADEIVQAKFYLSSSVCQALRELSAKTGKPQSKIVEEKLRPLLH